MHADLRGSNKIRVHPRPKSIFSRLWPARKIWHPEVEVHLGKENIEQVTPGRFDANIGPGVAEFSQGAIAKEQAYKGIRWYTEVTAIGAHRGIDKPKFRHVLQLARNKPQPKGLPVEIDGEVKG